MSDPEIEEAKPKTAPACLQIDPNGATVFIEFDAEKQCVRVDYDRTKVKTWDMIIGILHMGLVQAETSRNMTISANIQRQNAEMQRRQQEEFEVKMMAANLERENHTKKVLVGS